MPVIIGVMALLSRYEAPGWRVIRELTDREPAGEHPPSSAFPTLMVSISLAVCALTLFGMILLNETHRGMLAGFGIGLLVLATLLFALSRRMTRQEDTL